MSIRRVALLTAGGFAPCLSAAVGDWRMGMMSLSMVLGRPTTVSS